MRYAPLGFYGITSKNPAFCIKKTRGYLRFFPSFVKTYLVEIKSIGYKEGAKFQKITSHTKNSGEALKKYFFHRFEETW
jgi:hypothetical protein